MQTTFRSQTGHFLSCLMHFRLFLPYKAYMPLLLTGSTLNITSFRKTVDFLQAPTQLCLASLLYCLCYSICQVVSCSPFPLSLSFFLSCTHTSFFFSSSSISFFSLPPPFPVVFPFSFLFIHSKRKMITDTIAFVEKFENTEE